MRISSLWAQLTRAVRWHRRAIAALAAGCAVLLALAALSPGQPPGEPVVVAAVDIPAGSTLAAGQLRVVRYPVATVPTRSFSSPDELLGRVVAAPLSAGSPVTAMSTVSTELTPGRGELLAPFHVQDASVLSLLHVGDRITVVATGNDDQVSTVATRVRIAALPARVGGSSSSTTGDDALVVVATDPATAGRLAALGSQGLGIALG